VSTDRDKSELEILIREYITHCTDEELKELEDHTLCQSVIVLRIPGDYEDAEQRGIAWDTMNDEADAEDVRRYVADYWVNKVGVVTTSRVLFRHCWDRLYETLECQGYRRTPKGLIHPSDM